MLLVVVKVINIVRKFQKIEKGKKRELFPLIDF